MDPAPLTLAEFDDSLAAIGGFETRPLVAVAVSGGPDSLALMLLADRWARMHGGRAWGLTVDHGLRRESADEARMVALWLGIRGIPHDILRWVGPKPTSGIQEAAREARYRLLAAWCRERCCLHLLAAHHLEDQIETHLIRRHAGSGKDGLAGMPAVRELSSCRLVRPLLSVSRRRLSALLTEEGQPFLRDPSNLNPAFERARIRLAITHRSPFPLSGGSAEIKGRAAEWPVGSPGSPIHGRAALSRNAGEGSIDRDLDMAAAELRACASERIAREKAIDIVTACAVALHPAGFAVLDPAALAATDPETAARLLSRVIGCLGGARYPARGSRLARLAAALVRDPQRARTLGGCRFLPWRGRLLVLRELAAAEAPISLEPGADLLWDRRFAVWHSPDAAGAVEFGYLGQHTVATPNGGLAGILPPLIHPALPAFWDRQGAAGVPHLGYSRPGTPVLWKVSFRPTKALTPPSFTVV